MAAYSSPYFMEESKTGFGEGKGMLGEYKGGISTGTGAEFKVGPRATFRRSMSLPYTPPSRRAMEPPFYLTRLAPELLAAMPRRPITSLPPVYAPYTPATGPEPALTRAPPFTSAKSLPSRTEAEEVALRSYPLMLLPPMRTLSPRASTSLPSSSFSSLPSSSFSSLPSSSFSSLPSTYDRLPRW